MYNLLFPFPQPAAVGLDIGGIRRPGRLRLQSIFMRQQDVYISVQKLLCLGLVMVPGQDARRPPELLRREQLPQQGQADLSLPAQGGHCLQHLPVEIRDEILRPDPVKQIPIGVRVIHQKCQDPLLSLGLF